MVNRKNYMTHSWQLKMYLLRAKEEKQNRKKPKEKI